MANGAAAISWPVFLTVLTMVVPVTFGVGVYVGRDGVERVSVELDSHDSKEVHSGAVRRDVWESEQAILRNRLNALERRLDRVENGR